MANNLDKISKAYDLLKAYSGKNGYIIDLRNKVYAYKSITLNDFQTNFIIKNYDFEPIYIGKIVKIADWWAKVQEKEMGLSFTPKIIEIGYYMGEANGMYVFYSRFRKSQEKGVLTICKKEAILTDFLIEDYNKLQVDFDRYDKLASRIDPERKIKEEQKEAIKFLLSRKKCILADDMGLGKSLSLSVSAIEGNFDSIIIMCPASLKTNWKTELSYYTDEKYISIVDSFNDKKKNELEQFLGYKEGKSGLSKSELLEEAKSHGKWQDNKFVIINFDAIDEFYKIGNRVKNVTNTMLDNSPLLKYIFNKKSLLIIDEAHKLSNKDSIRYKVIQDLIKRGKPDSIYLSTGTPVTNNPLNLYHVLKLINHPITDNYQSYMERYCGAQKFVHPKDRVKRDNISRQFIASRGKSDWHSLSRKEKDDLSKFIEKRCRMMIVAKDATNLDELKERISSIYLRRTKDELDGLVKKNIHELFYDLTPTQEAEYNRLWAEYEEMKLSENSNKELNKDLLEGGIYRKYISNITVPYTEGIVDKLIKRGEKVIIACCYDEELYTLKEYYGDRCVVYNGKMSLKQKDEAIKRFYENPDVMVFLGNIIAAGVGINLVNARYMVFNNIDYVPGNNKQMEDRIWRRTQKRECHIVYQIFRNTQYEKIWNTVLKKELVIDQIIKKESEK